MKGALISCMGVLIAPRFFSNSFVINGPTFARQLAGGQGVVSDHSIVFCCMEIRPAALAMWILFSTKEVSSSPMGNSWEMFWSLLLQNETVLHKGNGLIFMSLFQMNKLSIYLAVYCGSCKQVFQIWKKVHNLIFSTTALKTAGAIVQLC